MRKSKTPLDRNEAKLRGNQNLRVAFAGTMMSGAVLLSAGTLVALGTGTYVIDRAISRAYADTPAQTPLVSSEGRLFLIAGGSIAGGGVAGAMAASFALAGANRRRRNLLQQKYQLEFRVIEGILQPPKPKS